jgi:hypothetical protein
MLKTLGWILWWAIMMFGVFVLLLAVFGVIK